MLRHSPTEAQRQSLRGFEIVHISSNSGRADDVCALVRRYAPSAQVVVVAIPRQQLTPLARMMSPVPVLRAIMDYQGRADDPVWTGQWERVLEMPKFVEAWEPGR